MIFINPHKCCTFVTEKSCLTSNANLCIIQKLKLLPSHYLYWGETLVNRSFLAIRHILAEFFGKILPNGVEIFSKTEGSTFYFQSPLPYLCTCTITVDAKRKDHVEERKSERQMKIETSRKFLDCTIIAYPFLRNGYNVVLQTSWKMEIAYKNGTAFREIPMKEEYGLSMLLASGFLQGCAAKHESGRWGLHQWLLSCGGVCKQNGTANQGMVFLLIG